MYHKKTQKGVVEMEDKMKKLLEIVERYDSCRSTYTIEVSIYAGEWIVSYKKMDFEWYGETLEKALDEAIEGFDEMIREREEEEREYQEQLERDYWAVQGAKTGKVSCF